MLQSPCIFRVGTMGCAVLGETPLNAITGLIAGPCEFTIGNGGIIVEGCNFFKLTMKIIIATIAVAGPKNREMNQFIFHNTFNDNGNVDGKVAPANTARIKCIAMENSKRSILPSCKKISFVMIYERLPI